LPSRRAQKLAIKMVTAARLAAAPRSSARVRQLGHAPDRSVSHPAERYEQQNEFWSSYRRHFLELHVVDPAA